MRTAFVLLAILWGQKSYGAEIDPVVAMAWCTPKAVAPTPDRFTATDGVTYERCTDGVYRAVVKATTVATQGCGCQSGATCGASFCKANGGSGCPQSCPVKAASMVAAPPAMTYTLPSASGGCAGGNCPSSQSRPQLFPRLRDR